MNKIVRNKTFFIVIGIIVLIFSLSFIRNFDNRVVSEENFQPFFEVEQDIDSEIAREVIPEKVVVDLKGAVNDPGVYVMDQGERIFAVIERANGFHEDANKDVINLALLLEDEMVIFVPRQGQEGAEVEQLMGASSKDSGKVNINRATAEELEKLPGIGPAKAAAIVLFREDQGTFKSVEDIVRVTGIGPKSLEAMSEFIVVK